MSLVSKATSKYRTTIPREVRKVVGIRPGDLIGFEIEKGELKLRLAMSLDVGYSDTVATTLTEWNFSADDEAYRDL